MAGKTRALKTVIRYVPVALLTLALPGGCYCDYYDGPKDDVVTDASDVAGEVDEGPVHDEGVADEGRDFLGADTTGDADTDADVQTNDIPDETADAAVDLVIEVIPTQLDFEYSQAKPSSTATLTIVNNGPGILGVNSLTIVDANVPAEACAFSIRAVQGHTAPWAFELASGGFIVVEVGFDLFGPGCDNPVATLVIDYGAPGNQTVEVPMRASVIHAGVCRLQMNPAQIDLGPVPIGFPLNGSARFVNTGTDDCQLKSLKIADCHQTTEGVECPDPLEGEDSTVFTVQPVGLQVGGTVVAGGQAIMAMTYTPPPGGEDTTVHLAMLSFEAVNENDDGGVLPACGADTSTACAPNLGGTIVLDTNVYPQNVDFGLVGTGCMSDTARVCYYNTADAAVLLKVDTSGCGPEFQFTGIQENWDNAFRGVPWCIEVTYSPTDAGADQCTVGWQEYGTTITTQDLTLAGEGSVDDLVTDTFAAHEGQTAFDIDGIPSDGTVQITINDDLPCDDWTIDGDGIDAVVVLGDGCPVQHLDQVVITYDIGCEAIAPI